MDTSVQGTQILVLETCSHDLCICYIPLLKGHLYSGVRDTFCGFQKPRFNLHSGDNLALKKRLATKVIDKFKCIVVTKLAQTALENDERWDSF